MGEERQGEASATSPGGLGAQLTRHLRERPYAVLGIAAASGYALGGGLFSRMTRPLARLALGAFVVPRLQSQASRAFGELRHHLAIAPDTSHL